MSIQTIEEQLFNLKKELLEKKEALSRLEGQEQFLIEEMKKKFRVKNLEEAEEKLKYMENEYADLEVELDELLNEIEDMM